MSRPQSLSDGRELPRYAPGRDLLGYLCFSHGWTWLFWGVVVVLRWDAFSYPGAFFLVTGGAGPMLGGVIMTGVVGGRTELHELRRRLFDPGRIPARWWLLIVGFFPVVTAVTALLAIAVGLTSEPVSIEAAAALLGDPLSFLVTAGFLLLLGPLPEEIGWRGFLLDRLQLRWSALTSSLLVGVAWLSWHIPLFFINGYFEYFGGPPNPFTFATGIVVVSIFYTWLHNNTHRSLLAAVLFHFAQNSTGETFDLTAMAGVVQSVLFVLLAIAVVVHWGPQSLRRRGRRPRPRTGHSFWG